MSFFYPLIAFCIAFEKCHTNVTGTFLDATVVLSDIIISAFDAA